MSDDILCPDCGGLISGSNESGIRRCSCVVATPKSGVDSAAGATATETKKICSACGKDVTNKKRLKDERGIYWCAECAAADKAKKDARELKIAGIATCPDCSRTFPDSKMKDFQLTRLCPTCYKERVKISDKEEKKNFSLKVHKVEERHKLLKLAAVACVLILVALAKQMGWLPFL